MSLAFKSWVMDQQEAAMEAFKVEYLKTHPDADDESIAMAYDDAGIRRFEE